MKHIYTMIKNQDSTPNQLDDKGSISNRFIYRNPDSSLLSKILKKIGKNTRGV